MSGYSQFAPQGSIFDNNKAAVFIPEIWSRDVIRKRDESLVMYPFVSKIDFRGQKGDTIYLPFISDFGVNNKVSGAPVTFQSFAENRWTMVVNRYKEVSFGLDRLTEIQSQNDLRSIYTERAGWALARDIEYSLLAERATINGYNSQSNVITSNAPLDYTDILAACETLQVANIPMGNWRLIVSPKQHNSLLTQEQFISSDYSSTKSAETGRVGEVLGVPVYLTTSITTNSLTGYRNGDQAELSPTAGMDGSIYYPTQTPALRDGTVVTPVPLTAGYNTAILCHPDWVKLAMVKSPAVDYEWSVPYQQHHIVMTQIYDVAGFRPDHAVLINTVD